MAAKKKTRRLIGDKEKRHALWLAKEMGSFAKAGKALKINPSMMHRWGGKDGLKAKKNPEGPFAGGASAAPTKKKPGAKPGPKPGRKPVPKKSNGVTRAKSTASASTLLAARQQYAEALQDEIAIETAVYREKIAKLKDARDSLQSAS